MLRIRILLGDMPRMLHDIVGTIVDAEPDLWVVADGVAADALMGRVEREQPDVVVLCSRLGSSPTQCEDLLRRFPRLAVVALEDGGHRASIYMMRPMRFRLGEISRAELVSAIRRAAGPAPPAASPYDVTEHEADTLASQSGTQS